jgi:uncharacterized protein (DUF2141 family)
MINRILLAVLIILQLASCARRGAPSGGPKDENAPILINTIPAFKSTNFKEKEIKIYFDEYVKLKDLQKQLVVSPPLKYLPIITPIGIPSKKITIKIKDTLLENTTYVFNFGQSIEDNNEANIISNFKYIFSTGSYIDSLKINGNIADSFNKTADEQISILLYANDENYNDSIIFKEKPMYVANTLEAIDWKISNIKKGAYKLIALKDLNSDYIYNPKEDKIGYIDEVINIPTDSSSSYHIKLFKEIPEFQLTRPIEVAKGHIIFGYFGNADSLKIKLLDKTDANFKQISFFEKENDTLHYFYKGIDADSLQFNLSNKKYLEQKTVLLRKAEVDSLIFKSNIKRIFHFRDTIEFTGNNPIMNIDNSKITFTDKDTLQVPFTLKFSESKQKVKLLFERKEKQSYKLEILPNAITDFFEQTNDTLSYSFTTKELINYGSLKISVKGVEKYPIIVQLLSEKSVLIEEIFASSEQEFNFENLSPKKYLIRVILDENQNKKWDTGNFLKKQQPEKVYYFIKVIEIKENWFVNETFELN